MRDRTRAGEAKTDAARKANASGSIDRRIGDDDADARSRLGRILDATATKTLPHRHAVDGEASGVAEVGEQQHAHDMAVGEHPRGGPDAALPPQARHAGAGTHRTLVELLATTRGVEGVADVVERDMHGARVGYPRVIALADDGDEDLAEGGRSTDE